MGLLWYLMFFADWKYDNYLSDQLHAELQNPPANRKWVDYNVSIGYCLPLPSSIDSIPDRYHSHFHLLERVSQVHFYRLEPSLPPDENERFCRDEDLRIVNRFLHLRGLSVDSPHVTDQGILQLDRLRLFTDLDLKKTRVTEAILPAIANCKSLGSLKFPETCSDKGIQHLRNLSNLKTLEIGGMGITDKGAVHVSGLHKLTRLHLFDTSIGQSGMEALSSLTELEELLLTGRNISDKGVKHLAKLSKLKRLDLYHPSLGDPGLKYLASLKELEYLNLSGTKITDRGMVHLSALSNLRELNLMHTSVSDKVVDHLVKLRKLETIRLNNTNIGNIGLGRLAWLPNLTELDASNSNKTPEADPILRIILLNNSHRKHFPHADNEK